MTSPGNKVGSIADAVALVPDGTRLALGGFGPYQRPMAFVRELVRQRRRNLSIVGMVSGMEVDMLIGAGAIARLETSYVGLEKYGLARNFRRACEAGTFTMVDYPEILSFDRFRASREKLTFWPCDYLGGNDVLTYNSDIKTFTCPLTGRRLYAIPPADPEVAVVHAVAADAAGNVLMPSHRLIPQELDIHVANSCDVLIVTAERIVPHSFIRRHSKLNMIPAYRPTLIVEAPCGAHPTPTLGRWLADDEHLERYVAASASPEGFAAYLDEWVFGLADHAAYLERLGTARLTALQEFDTL